MTPTDAVTYYEQGLLTRDEVFGQLVDALTPESLMDVLTILVSHDWLLEFEPWFRAVEDDTPRVVAGQLRPPSTAAREAVQLWRDSIARTRRPIRAAGRELPAGTIVRLVEPRAGFTTWTVLVVAGSARVDLRVADLDYTLAVRHEVAVGDVAVVGALPVPSPHVADVLLHERGPTVGGSRQAPRGAPN